MLHFVSINILFHYIIIDQTVLTLVVAVCGEPAIQYSLA